MQIFKEKWKESIKNSTQSLKPTWKEREKNVKKTQKKNIFKFSLNENSLSRFSWQRTEICKMNLELENVQLMM